MEVTTTAQDAYYAGLGRGRGRGVCITVKPLFPVPESVQTGWAQTFRGGDQIRSLPKRSGVCLQCPGLCNSHVRRQGLANFIPIANRLLSHNPNLFPCHPITPNSPYRALLLGPLEKGKRALKWPKNGHNMTKLRDGNYRLPACPGQVYMVSDK